MEGMIEVTVTEVVSHEGTLIVFRGTDPDGRQVTFAADHRPAYQIIEALKEGEEVIASVPDYMVIGHVS